MLGRKYQLYINLCVSAQPEKKGNVGFINKYIIKSITSPKNTTSFKPEGALRHFKKELKLYSSSGVNKHINQSRV